MSFNGGEVTTPAAYKENFRQLAEGGWVGVTANPDFGGMGLPKSLSAQYEEMLCSADVAFSLYPGLTSGAIMTLDLHGSDDIKQTAKEHVRLMKAVQAAHAADEAAAKVEDELVCSVDADLPL